MTENWLPSTYDQYQVKWINHSNMTLWGRTTKDKVNELKWKSVMSQRFSMQQQSYSTTAHFIKFELKSMRFYFIPSKLIHIWTFRMWLFCFQSELQAQCTTVANNTNKETNKPIYFISNLVISLLHTNEAKARLDRILWKSINLNDALIRTDEIINMT